ncbi:MAG: hypothetical protein MSG64_16820, partial [Pyrinomonadaceae bacterium MAG19_C2-C3]|nr:hypothetical protein [Pyrinomonadaceae bacterium MAG19_C2-C3]
LAGNGIKLRLFGGGLCPPCAGTAGIARLQTGDYFLNLMPLPLRGFPSPTRIVPRLTPWARLCRRLRG